MNLNPKNKKKGNDRIYTPDWVAQDMIKYFGPAGDILEPCRGKGAFSNLLPDCYWTEIDDGKDFFEWNKKVDWIISNPPFSLMRKFILHSFTIADNIVYLVPVWIIFLAYGTVKAAKSYGGIKEIRWYGTGSKLGFPMGNGIGAVYWKRNYKGNIKESFYDSD